MPDYSSLTYWQSRFEKETCFEWLGPGDIMMPHLARILEPVLNCDENDYSSSKLPEQRCNESFPTNIFHIGSGTSQLSLDLRSLYSTRVVNIDFEQSCLAQLRQSELAKYGDVKMEYKQIDMLNWEQVESQIAGEARVLIIDKSTSDAISCGPDKPSPFSQSPISPVRVLALHLAALSLPGSIWIALSYSASRFDDIGEFWNVEMTEKVAAESGQTKEGVYAPEVWHTLYVLRRTNHPVRPFVCD
ncbi:hypothetical protein RHS04_06322 [Rhizoctonia solani]|uniref:Methyltransferase domain-containing protein n=1 Tax=Rhizoctonia solani TaxID=456999 RepID=A0A8H7H5G2_9AGAM|nr:hypothetical protein RHS04_06322 [Rhizoctonia solani]